MQREREALDSFLEPIDLNRGSIPNSSLINHSSSRADMAGPLENRQNHTREPTDPNHGTLHSFSGWDRGESSSSANHVVHDRANSKTGLEWGTLFDSCPLPDPASVNWSFDPPQPSIDTSSGSSATMQNYNFAHGTLDLNSNDEYAREPRGFYQPGCSEIDQNPTLYASSSNLEAVVTGSSSASVGNHGVPGPSGPSLGAWGSSCKRKTLEGTSRQCYSSEGNLSISSGPPGPPPYNRQEQINNLTSESSARNLTSRSNHGRREPVAIDNSRATSRSFRAYSSEPRSPVTITVSPSGPLSETGNEAARGVEHPYPPWNGPSGSRNGAMSGLAARAREAVGVRAHRRINNNNMECPMNLLGLAQQDQVDWSFVPGSLVSSRNRSTGSRAGPSSGGIRASLSPYASPHPSPSARNLERWPEAAGWGPFHRVENEPRIPRGPHLTSTSDEAGPSSRPQSLSEQRSPTFLMDVANDNVGVQQSLAAVESRHRLIRQVLSAVRRGVHLQAEDYMPPDPFLTGFAELHDRHRDMRLDVDGMSYEELLALEERIGNVNTGLSEARITGAMKQRKFESTALSAIPEPCCVCQEDYVDGDDMGVLDCGHEFHVSCIGRWLAIKNLCPICKTTALGT